MALVKRVLISVYDKSGLVDLCRFLSDSGVEIVTTSGTKSLLNDNNILAAEVAEITDFPQILGDRVKTLHPIIHGGILADRNNEAHIRDINDHKIPLIDLVIVNLYPFHDRPSIDMIDVGGPTMVRAAAKNFRHVCVVTDPSDYHELVSELQVNDMMISDGFKIRMAHKAFAKLSEYDYCIASSSLFGEAGMFPQRMTYHLKKIFDLRYGENAHQQAAFYMPTQHSSPRSDISFQQLGGKELSYNNILDMSCAFKTVMHCTQPTVAIIKHNTPCAVATSHCPLTAYSMALEADKISAFGGIVGINTAVTGEIASLITKMFTEVVIASDFDREALAIFKSKPNVRLVKCCGDTPHLEVRSSLGGYLIQEPDVYQIHLNDLKVVTDVPFELNRFVSDLMFAYNVCRHVTSNAIVVARSGVTVGIGCGQTNRVDSARLAMRDGNCKGAVLASDGFFPFVDIVKEAANAEIACIIQPGGSINDKMVIEEANKAGIPMVFTGKRCFKH